ncbi:MAG: glycosyltransferase family 4 protein [Clostridia bacterium]|nr:glycosyltransferase family 4 protein [Clostridia bacterium]
MKIYEIGTGYTPIPARMGAATEIVVEELTRSLLKKGVDVEIIDIKAKDRASTELPITEVGVPSLFTKADVSLGIMHKLKRVFYSVALAGKLKKILKRADGRVVLHFHNQYNAYFFFKLTSKKLRQKATVVYTNHNGYWSLPLDETKEVIKKRYFQEVEAMRQSDVVFALNEQMRNNIVLFLKASDNKVLLSKNGVNTTVYSSLPNEKVEQIKSEFNLQGKKVILQVGSVYENKGQERLVKLLSPMLKKRKDLIYAFVGGIVSQEYFEKINDTSRELGVSEQVIYLGAVSPGEELNRYYNMAECSVFSSTLESFGLVIIEAISAGTPVVMSNNLMFELSKGYYTYNSPDELVNIIDEILEKGKTEFADRSEVVEKYSWDAVAEDYLSKIKNI